MYKAGDELTEGNRGTSTGKAIRAQKALETIYLTKVNRAYPKRQLQAPPVKEGFFSLGLGTTRPARPGW